MSLRQPNANIYTLLSGFCLFFMALGVNRFAYTPVIPFLVHEHWLTHSQAGYVAGANLLGYFVGALIAHKFNQIIHPRILMVSLLCLYVIATSACIFDFGFWWLKTWRFILGLNNGIIMIMTPSLILANLSESQKAITSGIMFSGIGAGAFICSLLIPFFFSWGGVSDIWLGLAILTLFSCLVSLKKCLNALPQKRKSLHSYHSLTSYQRKHLLLALTGYFLYSIGSTPSLLFLSVYAHHTLGTSLAISSYLFSLFGIGCALGAISAGVIHHKLNNYFAVVLTSLIGIISILLMIWIPSVTWLVICTFFSGYYLMAMVTLMSLFVGQLIGISLHAKYWSLMTLSYASSQFIATYTYSYGLSLNLNYVTLFKIGALALTLSLVCYLCLPKTINTQESSQ
ncbi:YbfB/YjiJ family MFS transporter [uncultured Shewanella sp.]|uniref:YbfB/YjiJ family MFS transporter n=1 Tax=uncultured Shewanella sp. TaxID=173975 RepID=UPI00261DA5D3|nr:YbfB/YjiJ family MFS transporter [uncultured Shewanella sp.]